MFELGVLTAICFIAAVTLATIYQRRQDVLYGPYIEDRSLRRTPRKNGTEAPSS
ncbi:hypothetical protein ACQR1Y_11550 [Bradyrhizobium sp. HKCCYLRH3099]|uniref:hypothetical protein n=1 Tax=unclassified Bradyrhizobium TaxID=2631580 RepID=UPI003EBD7836